MVPTDDKVSRGRMSRIQQLPEELLDMLHGLLRRGVPQAEILRVLNPLVEATGEEPLSRSGLHRYATRLERVGYRMRAAREAADAWVAKFGDEPTGAIGKVLVEMLRGLAFDLGLSLQDAETVDPEVLNTLALTVQRIEHAAETGEERERKLRREILRETDAVAKREGLSADAAALIRAAIERPR